METWKPGKKLETTWKKAGKDLEFHRPFTVVTLYIQTNVDDTIMLPHSCYNVIVCIDMFNNELIYIYQFINVLNLMAYLVCRFTYMWESPLGNHPSSCG